MAVGPEGLRSTDRVGELPDHPFPGQAFAWDVAQTGACQSLSLWWSRALRSLSNRNEDVPARAGQRLASKDAGGADTAARGSRLASAFVQRWAEHFQGIQDQFHDDSQDLADTIGCWIAGLPGEQARKLARYRQHSLEPFVSGVNATVSLWADSWSRAGRPTAGPGQPRPPDPGYDGSCRDRAETGPGRVLIADLCACASRAAISVSREAAALFAESTAWAATPVLYRSASPTAISLSAL
jgi:hypothetical protein